MNLRKDLLPLLLVGAMFTQSCKEESTGPGTGGNNNTTKVEAKAGSSFTFDSTSSESNSTGSITYDFAKDDLTFGDRTNVRLVMNGADTAMIFAYNTDGSISMFFPNDPEMVETFGAGTWLRVPVSGGAGQELTVIDTTIIDPEFPIPLAIKLKFTTSHVGSSTVTVSGKSYAAHNVKLVTESNFFVSTVSENIFTWVPELGFYAKMQGSSESMGTTSTNSETLTSFTLVK
jgi:hypothetical protein